MQPVTEVDEVVCATSSPNNGAGALWCYGAPLIARCGERVVASALEVGERRAPLCNTRPRLFAREDGAWRQVWRADDFDQREPCPLAATADGSLFLSVNPLVNIDGSREGASHPHVLRFALDDLDASPRVSEPRWVERTNFIEHSYRGIASDAARGDLLLLNIDDDEQCWSYRRRRGNWTRYGRMRFPVRGCYPQVALRNGAAHVLAVGDIVEPIDTWRRTKFAQTQREWDYVFRRLFYARTPDIGAVDFAQPIEVDNVDATGGHILNLDLWLDGSGDAHVLYIKQQVTQPLRDAYFPQLRLQKSLEHCVIRHGVVSERQTLLVGGEGCDSGLGMPVYARLHATPDGCLWAVVTTEPEAMWLLPVWPRRGEVAQVDIREPLRVFFSACERGGSEPAATLDLFGVGSDPNVLRYIRIGI
jgi:hypothetical protein